MIIISFDDANPIQWWVPLINYKGQSVTGKAKQMAENEAHESIKPFHVFSTDQESASVNSYQNNSDKKKKK